MKSTRSTFRSGVSRDEVTSSALRSIATDDPTTQDWSGTSMNVPHLEGDFYDYADRGLSDDDVPTAADPLRGSTATFDARLMRSEAACW
jgi:hypothetical protein